MNLAEVTNAAILRQQEKILSLEGKAARDFNDAQKVLAQLINQARAIVKDGKRAMDRLTPEEQREVILDWFRALPAQQQKLFSQEIMRAVNGERAA